MRAPVLLLLLVTGSLLAADPALPAPDALVVHRDGAYLACSLNLPAGNHRVAIPWRDSGAIAVRGAAWSVAWEPVSDEAPPAPPVGLEALVAERNRLVAASVALTARRAAHQRIGSDLRVSLTAAAAGSGHDVAAWQASLDAWASALADLDAASAAERSARTALARRAEALARDAGDWLALEGHQQPIGRDDAMRALAAAPHPAGSQRVLRLSLATAATVAIEIALPVVRWEPSAVLAVRGAEAHLVRLATLRKPADLDLGTIPVVVTTTPLAPQLQGPPERRVRLGSEAVVNSQRRQVQTGTSRVDLPVSPAPTTTSAPAPALATDAGKADAVITERTVEPELVIAEDQPALRWDLGPLALPRDQERITAERPAGTIAIINDEWAVIPSQSPVAQRRLSVRLDDQPLLAGPLSLVVEDAIVGTDTIAAQAPGSLIALRAGEDPAVFAGPAVTWAVPPGEQSERRQRQGSTFTLHNFADAPRTIAVYQTIPVSRSAELTVTLIGTSDGAATVESGVLRWTFTIPAAGRQELALGWVLAASGGLKW